MAADWPPSKVSKHVKEGTLPDRIMFAFGVQEVNALTTRILASLCEHPSDQHNDALQGVQEETDLTSSTVEGGIQGVSNEDVNLPKVVFDIFGGGTETTSIAIRWALVYFLHHPDVQDKCYEEIHRVVGTERAPTIQDRPQLVYMEAVIMEVLHYANVVPLSVPHATPYDVEFRRYTIPKGTVVLPNLDSVMKAPETWGDPDRFRPERFIGEDGKLWRPEEFIPFSIGQRVCMGEALGRMELFLYLSTMVQRFQFLPPETGELPPLQGVLGIIHSPADFKVRAVPRMCSTKETYE